MEHALRVSRDVRKNDFYASLVDECVRGIVAAAGSPNIVALLMIGAPARGEATVVTTPEGPFSLSDVDLLCICPPSTDRLALRGLIAPWMAEVNARYSDRCTGFDVSIKHAHHLATPYRDIAMFETLRSPVVVWGDDGVLSSFGKLDIEEIPFSQSLTLLHNRTVEELLFFRDVVAPPVDHQKTLRLLYATVKLALDSVSAFLFLQREVPAGYTARVDVFLRDLVPKRQFAHLAAGIEDFVDELPDLASFKATGDIEALARRFGGSTETAALHGLAVALWRRYTAYQQAFWRTILGTVIGEDVSTSDIPRLASLYSRLESVPRSAVRALKLLRSSGAPEGLISGPRVLARSAFASPLVLAYLTAVVVYLRIAGTIDTTWHDWAIRKYCPFRLPGNFVALNEEEKRGVLLDRLALLHESVLLGRAVGRADEEG